MWLKTNISCLKDLEYFDEIDPTEEDIELGFGNWKTVYIKGLDDPLEHLPKFESRKEYLTRVYGNMWDLDKFDHSWYWKSPYWKLAKRIIEKNIGKSYDLAFSYFCKQLPYSFLQEEFTDYFIPDYYYLYFAKENPWKLRNDYIVDENKLIQLNPDRYIKSSNLNWKKIDSQSYYEKRDMIRKSNRLHKYLKSQIDYKAILKQKKNERRNRISFN